MRKKTIMRNEKETSDEYVEKISYQSPIKLNRLFQNFKYKFREYQYINLKKTNYRSDSSSFR